MRRLALIEQQRRRLYAEPAPSPGMVRLAALERLVIDLQRRVAVLERQPRQPEPLRHGNDDRKAAADRLDEAIRGLLDGHPRADELTARQIRGALEHDGFRPLPAERTVRLHLAAIRGNGNAGGVAAEMIEF